ncbi:hypothetical protein LTR66_006271 [Elasticomyces elasticus]|nr:hypothetical protein LTR66_006271 [Elasticomyces elasticus]
MLVSGRSLTAIDGAESLIGPLFNTVPFYLSTSPHDAWDSVVWRCHQFNVAALPFQHTSLRDIAKWTKLKRNQHWFDSLFVFQMRPQSRPNDIEKLWEELEGEKPQADYPLAFDATLANDRLVVTVVAQGHLCDQTYLRCLLNDFEKNLNALVAKPQTCISTLRGHEVRLSTKHQDMPTDLNGVCGFEWTPAAETLRRAIAMVAGLDESDVDEHRSILEYGLDSVDAIKLSSRLKSYRIQIPVSSIMRCQTIPRMLRCIGVDDSNLIATADIYHQQKDQLVSYFSKQPNYSGVERILPTSSVQEGLLAAMFQSDFHKYLNHDVLELVEGIDLIRLERAWEHVVKQTPMLRTCFAAVESPDIESTFAQIVLESTAFSFRKTEFAQHRDLPSIYEAIRKDIVRTHDSQPPIRLTLAGSLTSRFIILSMSHAMYDGYSLGLLHEDVRRAYQGDYKPRPDYEPILWQTLQVASDPEAAQYWQSLWSGVVPKPFPPLHKSQETGREHVNRAEYISAPKGKELRTFTKKYGLTMQALAQTSWSLVLGHYKQALDVSFAVILWGRDSAEAQEMAFPTMNTVASRAVLHGSRLEMVRYVQGTIVDAMQYQQYPLRKVLAEADKHTPLPSCETIRASKALLDTLFVYQKRPLENHRTKQLYESVGGPSETEYSICVEMEVIEDDVIWRTASQSTVLSNEGTSVLLRDLDTVLRGLLGHPDAPTLESKTLGTSICGLRPIEISAVATPPSSIRDTPKLGSSDTIASLERTIRSVLSRVSKLPEGEIDRNTSIFHLGLDSISSIKVSSLLRKESVVMTVSEIIKTATVGKMASFLSTKPARKVELPEHADGLLADLVAKKGLAKHIQSAGIELGKIEVSMPAAAGQVYMLSQWQRSLGQLFFPEFSYLLDGIHDISVLRIAWQLVTTRNPILRTVFVATCDPDIPFLQIVFREAVPDLVDLDNQEFMPSSWQKYRPWVAMGAEHHGNGLLLRLKIHHALYDAVSLDAVFLELKNACSGTSDDKRKGPRFQDLLAKSITAKARNESKAFWTEYLAGIETSRLSQPRNAKHRRVELFHPRLTDVVRIEAVARKQGLSVQSVLFAAYGKIYSTLFKAKEQETKDVIFGVYLANRSHMGDMDQLSAPTMNLLPLRVRLSAVKTLVDLARHIQEDLQEISRAEHAAAGLWEIERWTGLKIDSFVNFLKLPDTGRDVIGGSEKGEETQTRVSIGPSNESGKMGYARIVEPGDTDWEEPEEVRGNLAKDAYLYSIDVEAAIRDGALDIGVFCPEEMLDLEDVQRVIVELRDILNGVE